MEDDLTPWERQPRESAQAYQAFALYRDLVGRRSCAKVGQTLGKSATLMERWANRHRWVERVRDYDRYLDAIARADQVKAIVDFRKRAAQQARGKAQSLMLADMAIATKLGAPDALAQLGTLSLEDLISLSAKCAFALPNLLKAEALALGDVTDRPAEPTDDDFLTRAIASNDDLTSLAATLIQRASTIGAGFGEAPAVWVREPGEPGQVAESSAPDVPQSEVGAGAPTQDSPASHP